MVPSELALFSEVHILIGIVMIGLLPIGSIDACEEVSSPDATNVPATLYTISSSQN